MKLGLELYRNQLDEEHYRFARQYDCEHLVLHPAADFPPTSGRPGEAVSAGGCRGAETVAASDGLWTYDALARLTERINAAGLQVEAVDGSGPIFPPGDRSSTVDVRRWRDRFKAIIRSVGGAGIPVLGYDVDPPGAASGRRGRTATPTGFRRRLRRFLKDVLPVAEEEGVTLAAQVRQPAWYRRIMNLRLGARHALEFCVADMTAWVGEGMYSELEACLRAKRLACLRLGDFSSDVPRIVRLLRPGGYRGVVLPGRTPQRDGAEPGHAGAARALAELRAAMQEG